MSLFSGLLERRGWTLPEPLIKPWGGRFTAGQDTSASSIIGLPAVYACIRLLTSAVSRMPVDVLLDRGGVPRPYPAPRWLRQPILGNANANRITHFGQVMASLLLDGNAFVLVLRDDSYDVRELYVLDPRMVQIGRDTESNPVYRIHGGRMIKEVGADQMVHLPLQPFPGQERGLSPIEAARQVFGTGLATQEYQGRLFTDSATPPGYISTPQGVRVNAAELKKNWVAERERNIYEPGVLTEGGKYEQLSLTNEQAQFVELLKLNMLQAAMIYGVPPHMIGDVERSTSWGTGIEQQGIGFVTYTLNDYLVLIEEGYRRLVPNPSSYLRFNRTALLRGDAKSRADFYKTLWEIGAMSPDEVRNKEDLPPLEGGKGKDHYAPLNYAPITGLPPEVPAAQPEDEDQPNG